MNFSSTTPSPTPVPTPTPTPVPTATPAPTPAPIVHIRTRQNNFSHVDAPSPNVGTTIHLWQAEASEPNQDFQFTSAGELIVHGKCLVQTGAGNGSPIALVDCNKSLVQKWTYNNSTGELKSSYGMCMDLFYADTTNGTQILAFGCTGVLNQKWDFIR